MKSTPTARLGISSCCMPTIASRVLAIFAVGSTMLPAGRSTPFTNRLLLDEGDPVNSLTWTRPSWLASVQQLEPVHAPLEAFGPQVRRVCVNSPVSEFANV